MAESRKEIADLRTGELKRLIAQLEGFRDQLLDRISFQKGQAEFAEDLIKQLHGKIVDINKEEKERYELEVKREEEEDAEKERQKEEAKRRAEDRKKLKGVKTPKPRSRRRRKDEDEDD
jgi:hypothetical protein